MIRLKNKIPRNILLLDYPDILKDWDYKKNTSVDLKVVLAGSGKTAWWVCHKCGYQWRSPIRERVWGRKKCKICNSFAKHKPDIARQWHPTKNGLLTPFDVTKRSGRRVWWICKNGHEFETYVSGRYSVDQCPCCSNRKVEDKNSLFVKNPILAKDWDYKKNGNLTPHNISCNSGKIVNWKCSKCGNKWKSNVDLRTRGWNECKKCSSFALLDPSLLKEWHTIKNKNLNPFDYRLKSEKKVWWICKKGHEWMSQIACRVAGTACPVCNKIELKDGTVCDSKVEALFYLKYKKEGKSFIHNKKYGGEGKYKNYRYDFYFPYSNLYVEVTSYSPLCAKTKTFKLLVKKYFNKMKRKKKYVEKVLKAKFKLIQYLPTPQEYRYVQKQLK